MRWEGERQSDNVEDRRASGGGGGGFGIGGRSIGIGTIVIALLAWGVFGINPLTTIGMLGGGGSPQVQQTPAQKPPASDQGAAFVSTVLASTEDAWNEVFKEGGAQYRAPKLVLFRGLTPTACGTGQSAMGPFYCPNDQKVYLDMNFFDTLSRQLGAPGEFARAYVVAHEVGHHVQTLLGTTEKVDSMRGRISQSQQNQLSVRMELQADCYAGAWIADATEAKDANGVAYLQRPTDAELRDALDAAATVGDDNIQAQSGRVNPETWTHGSSAQRQRWFTAGYQNGLGVCDTFSVSGGEL